MEPEPSSQEVPAPQKKSSKTPWVILLTLLLLALAGFAYWYLVMKDSDDVENTVTATKVTTSSAKTASDSTQKTDDTAAITAALVTKTGTAADVIAVTISSNDGKYVKGTVGAKGEETGSGYFLAVKLNSDWLIVYSGQATPECSSINPHGFPLALVPECLDSNGNLVARQ